MLKSTPRDVVDSEWKFSWENEHDKQIVLRGVVLEMEEWPEGGKWDNKKKVFDFCCCLSFADRKTGGFRVFRV